MKQSINSLLTEIEQERQSRRYAVPMQPPASGERLQRLVNRALEELNYRFPAAYLDALGIVDGIDSNGIVLYASETQPLLGQLTRSDYNIEGILEANIQWRDNKANERFMFYGEAGDVVYCHDLTTNKFQFMDRVAQDVDSENDVFDTCEELLKKMFNHMLDRYGVVGEGE